MTVAARKRVVRASKQRLAQRRQLSWGVSTRLMGALVNPCRHCGINAFGSRIKYLTIQLKSVLKAPLVFTLGAFLDDRRSA